MRDNPIVQRAALLHDIWVDFLAVGDARLLYMLATGEERKLVQGFVAMESDERTGRLPDLFVTLRSQFAGPSDYGAALVSELSGLLAVPEAAGDPETGSQSATSEEPPLRWQAPVRAKKEADPQHFARAAVDFAAAAAPQAVLCFVLEPSQVSEAAAYQVWLQQVIARLPETVRLWILDDVDHPRWPGLASLEPVRVHARPADLDLPGARAEISAALPDGGMPSGRFRNGYLELVAAVAAGDLAQAQQQAAALREVAEAAGWFYLVVPVQFTLAAALLAQEDHQGALRAYEMAEAAALRGASHGQGGASDGLDPASRAADESLGAGEPPADAAPASSAGAENEASVSTRAVASAMRAASAKLRMPARLSQGSVLVAAGSYPRAATFYEDTAALAMELEQPLVVMDCLRLASFCHQQAGDSSRAWKQGIRALEAARVLPDSELASSTLPYLGDHLLRMGEQLIAYRDHADPIQRELDQRLGPGWRPSSG